LALMTVDIRPPMPGMWTPRIAGSVSVRLA
jgi:hypothetical protein